MNMTYEQYITRFKKQKITKDLYHSKKFLKFCYGIYCYCLEIPKSEIILKTIINRDDYFGMSLMYILCFLKARDFYHWKERIYTLFTKKFNKRYDKFVVLYGSEAKKYYDEYLENQKITFRNNYGVDYGLQCEGIKNKIKNTNLERNGCENPFQAEEIKERIKQTNLEKHGKEYYSQTEEFKERYSNTCMSHFGYPSNLLIPGVNEKAVKNSHSKDAIDKRINTCLEIYGHRFSNYDAFCSGSSHSKIGDEFCNRLKNLVKHESVFEYALGGKVYDFCIPEIKVIVEFDGVYWHGLIEGQKDVLGIPVEEIWKRDEYKQKLAEMNGFRVIRVREDEYMADKEKVLNNIVGEIDDRAKNYRCIE